MLRDTIHSIKDDLLPNPGSKEAIKFGCKCDPTDNGRGEGCYFDPLGKPVFWINELCPIHAEEGSGVDEV